MGAYDSDREKRGGEGGCEMERDGEKEREEGERKKEKERERKKERRPSIVRDEDGSLLAKYDGWCEEHVNRHNDVSVWRVVQR